MLKITFLGTSAATPSVERSMPSIALKCGDLLLWDCGEGTQRQMMKHRVGLGSIKAIFITHLHLDHFLGVYGMIETLRLNRRKEPLYIYAPEGFGELLINRWDFVQLLPVKVGELFEGKDYTISAFRVKHQKNSFGFIYKEKDRRRFDEKKCKKFGLKGTMFKEIQERGWINIGGKRVALDDVSSIKKGMKVVYSGDSVYCRNTVRYAEEADLLIHEGTFHSEKEAVARERAHSTVVDAARTACEAGVKRLIITHISGRYKDPKVLLEEARTIFKNTEIAYDGMNVELRS